MLARVMRGISKPEPEINSRGENHPAGATGVRREEERKDERGKGSGRLAWKTCRACRKWRSAVDGGDNVV